MRVERIESSRNEEVSLYIRGPLAILRVGFSSGSFLILDC